MVQANNYKKLLNRRSVQLVWVTKLWSLKFQSNSAQMRNIKTKRKTKRCPTRFFLWEYLFWCEWRQPQFVPLKVGIISHFINHAAEFDTGLFSPTFQICRNFLIFLEYSYNSSHCHHFIINQHYLKWVAYPSWFKCIV